MSQPSSQPPVLSRTELETVVCWPLIYGAAGVPLLALTILAGLATFSALSNPSKSEQVAVRPSKAPSREVVSLRPSEAPVQVQAPPVAPSRLAVPIEQPSAAPTRALETPVPDTALPPTERSPAASKPAPAVVPVPAPSEPPARLARADKASAPATPPTSRRNWRSEDELLALLITVPELDLETEKGTKAKLLAKAPKADKSSLTKPIQDVLAARADLRGLPVRNESDCLASAKAARSLELMSRNVRGLQALRSRELERARTRSPGRAPSTSASDHHALAEQDYAKALADQALVLGLEKGKKVWGDEKAVGPLMQMLQPDSLLVRQQLVKILADVKGRAATEALARLAVFDLSLKVREDAVTAIKKRDLADARPVFLSALRYPWAPAADHAAEALVTLDDRKAGAELRALLTQPDPAAPFLSKDKKLVVTELVRVNHLRNCVLCHAVSSKATDRVRGFVPTPGEAIPIVYYARGRGDFVRADVTYLKQDFSTMLPVADAHPWPAMQRYDYLLRTRELSAPERAAWAAKTALGTLAYPGPSYPQREAVLFASEYLKSERPAKKDTD